MLQGLTYQPTGALVAAVTTSLPDRPGRSSSDAWDYRYGWLRDAGLVARALDASHDAREADRYFDWMVKAAVTCGAADHVQVMYGVEAERDLTERVLDHLDGFDGALVRVGNAAWTQTQLDVLGEVLAVAARRAGGLAFDDVTAGFLRQLADRAARDWSKPDAGIWEWRDELRQHTAAKACCWMALDRACGLAPRLGAEARPRAWAAAAAAARATVLERAWSASRGAFAGELDGDRLDCSVLLLVLTKLLDARDPRAEATCRVLSEELGDGSGLLRRTEAVGFEDDTAFLLCSGWMAECHARGDRVDEAVDVLSAMWRCATDVGLLAERAEFGTSAPVGNLPLGLSHASFITAAVALRDALERREHGGRARVAAA